MNTTPKRWSEIAQEKGVHLKGISANVITLLKQIKSEPLPMQKRCRDRKNVPSPSPIKSVSLGPLVVNKLVALSGEFYRVTPAGDEYLVKLEGAGLL